MAETGLPLEGVRVIEMTHMVMGPTCGMILAQLGAEVIKVEPPVGDPTRALVRGGPSGTFIAYSHGIGDGLRSHEVRHMPVGPLWIEVARMVRAGTTQSSNRTAFMIRRIKTTIVAPCGYFRVRPIFRVADDSPEAGARHFER